MKSIGIRELRQNASVHVREAELGETIQVTDRGRPVALLTPLPRAGRVEEFLATGRLHFGDSSDGVLASSPIKPCPGVTLPSDVLRGLRDGER